MHKVAISRSFFFFRVEEDTSHPDKGTISLTLPSRTPFSLSHFLYYIYIIYIYRESMDEDTSLEHAHKKPYIIYVCVCVCVYIHIERERENGRRYLSPPLEHAHKNSE